MVRTAENIASQTTYSMRDSMPASAVRAVFGLLLPVLHFVGDPCTLVHLRINFTELNFHFCSVNVEIIVQNVSI